MAVLSRPGHQSPTMLRTFLAICSLSTQVHGFFATDWTQVSLGKSGVSHQQMTRNVIDDVLLGSDTYFPGEISSLTTYMINAREEITKANIDTDGTSEAAAHFSNEQFAAGQKRLVNFVTSIVSDLEGPEVAVVSARSLLGEALHTVQDFYSNTNWVELGNTSPYPGLGVEGVTIENTAGPTEDTCIECSAPTLDCGDTACLSKPAGPLQAICLTGCDCPDCGDNLVTDKLTSGYHSKSEPSPAAGVSKCHHGGLLDTEDLGAFSYRSGINKDSNACTMSPHSSLHPQAAELAILATRQFLDHVADQLTTEQLRLLFGFGTSLAFAIDTTGSMAKQIIAVRANTKAIVESTLGTLDEPSYFVLAEINDPAPGTTFTTSNSDTFQTVLGNLKAYGGGDCKEMSMSGTLAALSALPHGGTLIVITDAGAKDPELLADVIESATKSQVKVLFFVYGSACGGTDEYAAIAAATGGQMNSGLDLEDIATVNALIGASVKSDLSALAAIAPTLDTADVDLTSSLRKRSVRRDSGLVKRAKLFDSKATVDVESGMKSLSVSIAGVTGAVLIRPDGVEINTSSNSSSVFAADLSTGVFFSVDDPLSGPWGIRVKDCDECDIRVFGEASLHLSALGLTEIRGLLHPAYMPLLDAPIVGCEYPMVAKLDGDFASVTFEMRRLDGSFIMDVAMTAGSGGFGEPGADEFFGTVEVPAGPFLLYARGSVDAAGMDRFVRVIPGVVLGVDGGGKCPDTWFTGTGTTTGGWGSTSSSSSYSSSETSASIVTDHTSCSDTTITTTTTTSIHTTCSTDTTDSSVSITSAYTCFTDDITSTSSTTSRSTASVPMSSLTSTSTCLTDYSSSSSSSSTLSTFIICLSDLSSDHSSSTTETIISHYTTGDTSLTTSTISYLPDSESPDSKTMTSPPTSTPCGPSISCGPPDSTITAISVTETPIVVVSGAAQVGGRVGSILVAVCAAWALVL